LNIFTSFFIRSQMFPYFVTLERSRAERSKDHNKATAVTTKLQRSNSAQTLICFTEQSYIKRNGKWSFAPLCYTQMWTSFNSTSPHLSSTSRRRFCLHPLVIMLKS